MTRRRVRFTARAQQHVRLFKEWWRESSARPEILEHDVAEAVRMLSIVPGIGSIYRPSPIAGVRRLYLQRLMAHLYYTYDEREVVIRAVWHARRGSAPDLG
ncbi:MAG TPA: type II toxin-antitoxin system RelE/ParE family toxin [Thermoanaerobaculia bacterium]